MSFGGPQSMFGTQLSAPAETKANQFSMPNVSGMVVAVVLLVALVSVVLGYLVYRFLVSSLQSTALTSGIVHCKTGARTLVDKKLPALTNGKEWAVSFWIYLETSAHTNSEKHVFAFGSDRDAAPFSVMMDRNVNRLYLIFRTANAPAGNDTVSQLVQFKSGVPPESHIIVPIEYVPLSRWVMVTAVVDQDTVTTYFDNSIYSVVSTARFKQNAIIADPAGDVVIGSASSGADAFLSKLRFYNYSVSVYQVQRQYSSGPGAGGILAAMGISKYRLQWPVTRATS
jgi:hypothetical protein